MLRKFKNIRFYSSLLIVICATVSFLSVKGWCIDNGNEIIETHVELSACHSKIRTCDEPSSVVSGSSHEIDNNNCSACVDVSVDSSLVASKSFNNSSGWFVSAPLNNSIFLPQQCSKLKNFSVASSGGAVAIDQSTPRQNLQAIAIRTVVLLI